MASFLTCEEFALWPSHFVGMLTCHLITFMVSLFEIQNSLWGGRVRSSSPTLSYQAVLPQHLHFKPSLGQSNLLSENLSAVLEKV